MDAPNKPLGVMVVGVGFLGSQRAAAAKACPSTHLVGIHDADRLRKSAVSTRLRTLEFTTWEEGLDHPDVNLVVVATPHADHAEIVSKALHAGKHVLCEKPLAIDSADAFALAKLADDAHLKLATGLNHRFFPPVRDALALEHAWSIGRIESVRVEIGHAASPEFLQSWHTDIEVSGGGTLIDNGPHACDLIRKFLGEVVAAKGYVQGVPFGDPHCDFEAFGLFRGHQHASAELHSSWNLHRGYLTIDVRGDDGHLHVETAPWRLSGVLAGGKRVEKTYFAERVAERLFRMRHGCERSLVLELEDFVAGCRGQVRDGATGWDGVRVAEMIEAIYLSDRTGDEIAIKSDVDLHTSHRSIRSESARSHAGRL